MLVEVPLNTLHARRGGVAAGYIGGYEMVNYLERTHCSPGLIQAQPARSGLR